MEAIVSARDVDDIYKVPLTFREQGVDDFILEHFALEAPAPDLTSWQESIERSERASRTVRIALVGKYVQLEDAYLSVSEALRHAASSKGATVEIDWIDSERIESSDGDDVRERLERADGILIPGGFGGRRDRGQDRRGTRRARARASRTWASAWGCTWRSPSSRATSRAWTARTRRRWTWRRRFR